VVLIRWSSSRSEISLQDRGTVVRVCGEGVCMRDVSSAWCASGYGQGLDIETEAVE
jgi:hypothetical protein